MLNGSSEQWESMWKATISGWQGCLNVLIRRQLGQTAKGRDGRRWMQHTSSNSFHVFTSDLICTCAHRNVVNTVTQKIKPQTVERFLQTALYDHKSAPRCHVMCTATPISILTLLVGQRWLFICWWWRFDWSCADLTAPVVTNTPSSLATTVSSMETFWH